MKKRSQKSSNSRNGYTAKTLLSDDGEFEMYTPRDREGTFEPQLMKVLFQIGFIRFPKPAVSVAHIEQRRCANTRN